MKRQKCALSGVGPCHATAVNVPKWKRRLDVALTLLALPVIAPVMLAIAGLIKLVSTGPVFFRQERIGLGGRRFECLKFRTMQCGASSETHQIHLKELIESSKPMSKLDKKDARLIPLGWLLRSSGLDELPQLINVWRGEMSLVGPRPCVPYEFQLFKEHHLKRFETLPGLTGLWQVSGKNETNFEQMIALDIRYVRKKTIWMDLWIMIKTPLVLVLQVKAGAVKSEESPPSAAKSEALPVMVTR